MRWRTGSSVRPAPGYIPPCLPTIAKQPPTGPDWVYELKHDGYRLLVRRQDTDVRVYSRNGANFTERFPRIVEAVRKLRVKSVLLDGEGIVYNGKGMPDFRLLHGKQNDEAAQLIAFDLLQLDGDDLRSSPLLDRKKRLARLLIKLKDGIQYNDHLEGDGRDIYAAACKLGHEGIVAKRRDLAYQSGPSKRWLKIKNPDSPAMQRVMDERF
jgi:bifunctional non-homologous end joining protein LigD